MRPARVPRAVGARDPELARATGGARGARLRDGPQREPARPRGTHHRPRRRDRARRRRRAPRGRRGGRERGARAPGRGRLARRRRRGRRRGGLVSGLPVVALIGRPNAGKSTLFNRLCGQRIALVHDQPGVTRDRHYAEVHSHGRRYLLVDTAGFDPESDDPMRQGMQRQLRIALAEADVVVCLLDATSDVASSDSSEMSLLRRADKPVVFVANKADTARVEQAASELYRLGMKELHFVSALHGRGVGELEAAIAALLPAVAAEPEPAAEGELAVAIVGRPNAGKSSMVNRILGEERLLVDAAPGTTRDPIDTRVTRRGQPLLLVDTAGLRKKASVTKSGDAVEAMSTLAAVKAIERATVAVLVCDAERGVDEQDTKVAGLVIDRQRCFVVALNKCDKLDRAAQKKAVKAAQEALAFATWAPICETSARTGRGIDALIDTVKRAGESYRKRVPTGELNRFFEDVLTRHPPPTSGGKAPRFYYITQAETAPPVFVVMTSAPDKIHWSYRRYVHNAIRQTFGFQGSPLVVRYREPSNKKTRGRAS
ncbi:MAG: ribosome biogenesis GTPase Der [Polyangiaceae bacterium]|nr:ribosome biogenesis GTPase Der [Polyangiaceae bacterium]